MINYKALLDLLRTFDGVAFYEDKDTKDYPVITVRVHNEEDAEGIAWLAKRMHLIVVRSGLKRITLVLSHSNGSGEVKGLDFKVGDFVTHVKGGHVAWAGQIVATNEKTGWHTINTPSGPFDLHDKYLTRITQKEHEYYNR